MTLRKILCAVSATALAFTGAISLPIAASAADGTAVSESSTPDSTLTPNTLNSSNASPHTPNSSAANTANRAAQTAGSWSLDPTTAKPGTLLTALDKKVRFQASKDNANGTMPDQYPAIAVHQDTFDFTQPGSFRATFTSENDPAATRFGFYLGYDNPGRGLFIGYDSGGWFWQRYGVRGNPYHEGGRNGGPKANKETSIEISWTGTTATLKIDGLPANGFENLDYSDMADLLTDKIAMKAGTYGEQITAIVINDENAVAANSAGENPADPAAALKMPDTTNKIELVSGNTKAYLYREFPQVAFYEHDGKQLAGHLGEPLQQIFVNEQAQNVTVADVQVASDKTSASYRVQVSALAAELDVKISLQNQNLRWEITEINDPRAAINRLAIPKLDLVTVDGAKNGQLTFADLATNRTRNGDTHVAVAQTEPAAFHGWFAAIHNTELAAGLFTNALADDEDRVTEGRDVKHRWIGTVTTVEGVKLGSIYPGSWVIYGTNARGDGKIGRETLPYAQVRIVADANESGQIDWQDSAIATRDLMAQKLPNGYADTKNNVVQRIPFNIVSQATHPFLRTLDDTKRISLATDNLGQLVLLKGYQAEGHDSAQGDYGSHYNTRAGGFQDLVTLLKSSKNYNAQFGVHVNATETYSEAQCFSDGAHEAAGTGANYENPCTLQMPPRAAWGWMNQAYYLDPVKDLTSQNVLKRFENFRKELTEAGVQDRLDWLYFDVYYRTGWLGHRLSQEMQKQGWRIGSEWAYSMPDYSLWSHWATDENYGGQEDKGLNSLLVRFIQNSWRDTFNPDPLLGNPNLKEFEGWTGHVNYKPFIDNIWQRNLPAKFLQQSHLRSYELGKAATFENGTTVTSSRRQISGTDLGYDRVITYGGKTVYTDGKYLLPWGETAGIGEAKDAASATKLYHYNPAGGSSTWQLPGKFAQQTSFTLYKLTDDGRVKVATVPASNGQVTLNEIAPHTAYVLYPNEAPTPTAVQWGEGSSINDPGFFSGNLHAYQVTGAASVITTGLQNRQAQLGAGESAIAQQLHLPKGDYSIWAWVEIQNGKSRLVSASVSGQGVRGIGNQAVQDGVPTSQITMSTAPNATASDEKLNTNFQRLRVTFHTDGQPVTFKIAAAAGDALVNIDDLRVVEYQAPKDPHHTAQTVFFDDFESVDSGYWPFVTGRDNRGGDARTQMAENHPPYSNAGWYGKNQGGTVVQGGKLTDNVLAGKWSLLAHEENQGLILRTTPASLPFMGNKTYRVSFAYQNAYAGEYVLVVGRDRLDKSGNVISSELQNIPIPQARGTGVAGNGTQVLPVEFTTSSGGDYWIGIRKAGRSPGSDLTIDNLRVELINDRPQTVPGNADPVIELAQETISEGTVLRVGTHTDFFEAGTPSDIRTQLTGPKDWQIRAAAEPSGAQISQNWEVTIPQGASDGTLTYTVSYQVDSDGITRTVSKQATVKVVRAIRDGVNFLSDLPWTDESNGWGPVERDQSNGEQGAADGSPITMGGKEYAKGIGMHAHSGNRLANITFDLGGKCATLHAVVGVNDNRPNGSVTFKVLADAQSLYESPAVVTNASGVQEINLDVTGVQQLQLQVGNGGNGNGSDHANWANAQVVCSVPNPTPTPGGEIVPGGTPTPGDAQSQPTPDNGVLTPSTDPKAPQSHADAIAQIAPTPQLNADALAAAQLDSAKLVRTGGAVGVFVLWTVVLLGCGLLVAASTGKKRSNLRQ